MEPLKISLAAARVNARMTQAEVAEILKISKSTLASWERGITEPKVAQAEKLSELYNIPSDNIFFNDKSRFK